MLRPPTESHRAPDFDAKWVGLVESAAGVFAELGYDKASMRRLAKASGISLAGIYHYVAGKEELLYRIQLDTFESLLSTLEACLEGVEDPRERLELAVRNHVRHFGEHMNALKVCARELETLDGDLYEEVYEVRRAYFQAVHDVVKALPRQPGATIDPWLATANLFGMLNWFYQWYDPQRSPVSLDALAAQQTALFLNGYAVAAAPAAGAGGDA